MLSCHVKWVSVPACIFTKKLHSKLWTHAHTRYKSQFILLDGWEQTCLHINCEEWILNFFLVRLRLVPEVRTHSHKSGTHMWWLLQTHIHMKFMWHRITGPKPQFEHEQLNSWWSSKLWVTFLPKSNILNHFDATMTCSQLDEYKYCCKL